MDLHPKPFAQVLGVAAIAAWLFFVGCCLAQLGFEASPPPSAAVSKTV
jgi:hypothetical protein